MTNRDLQQFADRAEMASALRKLFPHLLPTDTALSPTRGGRIAAKAALSKVEAQSYERSRNYLAGSVTRLSAYLRHGVLTLAEVRDDVLARVADPRHAGKLVNELGWRDYWQRLYLELGEGIWQDREPYKTGYEAADYDRALPAEVAEAATTLYCIDSFSRDLTETGYLHNHARMWFAAYLAHWRRVRWQAGAHWFLEHLIDGDPASNNLSWQWVASTFASKAYIFNKENLERYTDGLYCRACPHARAGTCPFDSDYDGLQQTLFPRFNDQLGQASLPAPPQPFPSRATGKRSVGTPNGTPLIWVHTDSLNPDSPMLREHPDSPAVFVWDIKWLAESQISLKRIVFLAECLREMPGLVELRVGDPATELLGAAQASGAAYILAQRTADPSLQAAALTVERLVPVVWFDPPPFAGEVRSADLKRFSRYWKRAEFSAMQPTRSR